MEEIEEKRGFVTCRECNKNFGMITPQHLRAAHQMTTEQYKNKYPNQDLWGKGFRTGYKQTKSGINLFNPVDYEDKIPKGEEIRIPVDLESIEKKNVETEKKKEEEQDADANFPPGKLEIFKLLKDFFHGMKTNYFIEKIDVTKRLEYRVITDFCDPERKLIIDFPNAFWHNYELQSESLKQRILPTDGWKIIKILERNPTVSSVDKELRSYKEKGIIVF